MYRTLYAGALILALAVSPCFATTKKAKSTKHPHAVASQNVEDAAWGGAQKKTVKKQVKKTVKKPTDASKATVKLSPGASTPTTTLKTPDSPEEKPTVTVKPTEDPGTKSAEDMEKLAQTQMQKDPKKALDTYGKLLENNPNYPYAGDVYANMYNLSVKNRGSLLDQIKFAGKAAQSLEAGQSHGPVTPQSIKQYKNIEEKLINKWIETEIQKIQSGQATSG